ncbi:MAG: sugar phosphate isomerase/epimerase [Saprospiraceae bacterium]|nr:sugar phosphate isomerase/epimerase [Saprospiraceae bacterium]
MSNPFSPNIVCTYLYTITKYGYPPPADKTMTYLEEMAALNFQSIELEGIRESHLREMHKLIPGIQKDMARLNLQIPVFCTVLPHLSSTDLALRDHQLDLFRLGCETAHSLGARFILDNGPLPPYHFPREIPVTRHYEHELLSMASVKADFKWPVFWNTLIDTFQKVCDIAAEYELTYLVHPAFGVLAATPEAFLHFAGAVNRDNLGYNFDTANLIALKCNLSLAIQQLAPFIKYIHLSDNRGMKNEHLEPGLGIINWSQFFRDLAHFKYDGPIGIDIGGDESEISNLDDAYTNTALFINSHWPLQPN